MQELKSKHKEAALGKWSDLAELSKPGPQPCECKTCQKKDACKAGVQTSGWCVLPWHGVCTAKYSDLRSGKHVDRVNWSWAG